MPFPSKLDGLRKKSQNNNNNKSSTTDQSWQLHGGKEKNIEIKKTLKR